MPKDPNPFTAESFLATFDGYPRQLAETALASLDDPSAAANLTRIIRRTLTDHGLQETPELLAAMRTVARTAVAASVASVGASIKPGPVAA